MGLGTALGQSSVNTQPAPAVQGDFCSANPWWSVDAGPGGLVAGAAGVTVGRFAWASPPEDGDGFPAVVSNAGAGPVTGFVGRRQQALIVTYLADSSMLIAAGFGLTLYNGGDFWIVNDGAAVATPGMKAYAANANGKASFAATGAPTQGGTSTASTIAAGTASVTGSIANDVLTVTAVGSGAIVVGGQLSGTGVASGTQVIAQLSGAAGGVGTYRVTPTEQTVASTTISETYGTLTIGGSLTGTFAVGDLVTGSGVTAGTVITALGTGTGGAGTYIVNTTQTIGSQAINVNSTVETKFVCMSTGQPGELVKISSQALG